MEKYGVFVFANCMFLDKIILTSIPIYVPVGDGLAQVLGTEPISAVQKGFGFTCLYGRCNI